MTTNKIDPFYEREVKHRPLRRPPWLKIGPPKGKKFETIRSLMRSKQLNTVCEEARCPNIGECWGNGTATFLILGDICTRKCGFCDIKTGRPLPIDWTEPERVAQAVKAMGLHHVVITSVNRDERSDGGAPIFALCIERIRQLQHGCSIEVLIPDFKGSRKALGIVMEARPDILNHNIETVNRLFRKVQPQDHYEWALSTLDNAKRMNPEGLTKSGLMVGLGEKDDEILRTMADLAELKVDILTIGQYLQPTREHLPIVKYYRPEEFERFREAGLEMGFRWVESGPLVRSSYRAEEQISTLAPGSSRSISPSLKMSSTISTI
jgi:lipoic acid synthetase